MKHIVALTIAATILLGGSLSYAGSACCSGGSHGRTGAKANKDFYCSDVLSKLNLSDDQKKKIADLKAECDKQGCSESTQTKYWNGIKEILTPEQLSQCKSECEKAHKTACPLLKSDPKS